LLTEYIHENSGETAYREAIAESDKKGRTGRRAFTRPAVYYLTLYSMQYVQHSYAEGRIPVCILAKDHDELNHFLIRYAHSDKLYILNGWVHYSEAIKALPYLRPAVALISYRFDGDRGYDIARNAHFINKELRIAGYSFHYHKRQLFSMVHAGALGFFTDETVEEERLQLIEHVAQGMKYRNSYYTTAVDDEIKACIADGDIWWREDINEELVAITKVTHTGMTIDEMSKALKIKPDRINYLTKKARIKHHLNNGHDMVCMIIREGKFPG